MHDETYVVQAIALNSIGRIFLKYTARGLIK